MHLIDPEFLSILTVSKETAAHWYSEGTLHKQLREKGKEYEKIRKASKSNEMVWKTSAMKT